MCGLDAGRGEAATGALPGGHTAYLHRLAHAMLCHRQSHLSAQSHAMYVLLWANACMVHVGALCCAVWNDGRCAPACCTRSVSILSLPGARLTTCMVYTRMPVCLPDLLDWCAGTCADVPRASIAAQLNLQVATCAAVRAEAMVSERGRC